MKMKKRIVVLLMALVLAVGLIGCKDTLKSIVHKASGTSDEVQEEDTTRWADQTSDPLIIQGIADSSAKFATATADGCLYAVFNGIWSRQTSYFTVPSGTLSIMGCGTAGGIQYELTRKRVKNLNIRVREDGTVAVSIPLRTSAEAADRFVAARADWVQQARERAMRRAAQEARPLPDKETALAYFTAMSDKVYPAFAGVLGGHKPVIKVRSMTSRWGVCFMAKRQITFALQLYHMPPAAQIYVVVHEYCHFLQPNHSPAFWAEVAKLLPDWKARRALLK